MSAVVIIPARFGSTRFPGKPLVPLKGKPLIQHVYENSSGSRLASGVIVATDSKDIFDAVVSFGGKAVMTSPAHRSGTDRVAEAAGACDYDIIINVQGDEPLIKPAMIDDVIGLLDDGRASIGTLAKRLKSPEETADPNVVKVVFDPEGFALYFSRAPIPYPRDGGPSEAFKHIGIYSYRKEALRRLAALPPSRLELIEKLEQLRALEAGMKIKVKETRFDTIGVDTPEDLKRVEKWLSSSS